MSKIAIIKIHPGLNMALPQLSGDLERAGHESRMYFFKDYAVEDQYFSSSFERDGQDEFDVVHTEFEKEYDALADELDKFGPDAIGLSVISLSIPEAIKTTQFLRTRFNLPILWGGVGVTLEPEIAIRTADLVCVGEGEEVQPGQPLATVEAMKMENILRAEKEGTIAKINAEEGESLAVDAVILELE